MQNNHRRSIRLQGADYGAIGTYFITVCSHERACLFGHIVEGSMILNSWGKIVTEEWQRTTVLRPNIELDAFVVMPNHFHALLIIKGDVRGSSTLTPRTFGPQSAQSLATIVGTFKASVTRQIRRLDELADFKWQRNYYEHIIRDEDDENRIRGYILSNPERWKQDSLFMG
jgi:putative transposase